MNKAKYFRILLLVIFSLIVNRNSFTQIPSNDNCFGAISLTPSSTCIPVNGTTLNATQSIPGCTGVANDDVWFLFTATQVNLAVQVSGSTGFNAVVEVFSGGCSNYSSLACANSTGNGGTEIASLTNLIVGVTYWIRVYHFSNLAPSSPTFTICVSPIATIPSCLTATPAGNTCSSATLICNVDGYCGSTAATYTADYWPELGTAFCGSIENNSFISFVANASMVSLNVWVTSSTQNNGIQMMVFSAQNCSGPVNMFACYSPMPPGPSAQVVTVSGLTAGNTYYLMIDGYAGDVCDYVIGVNSGILVSGNITATQTNICFGNSVTLTASGGDGNYNWGLSADLNILNNNTAIATPTTTGPHSYTMTTNSSNPLCPSVSTTGITINVYDTPQPNAGIDDTICLGTPIYLQGQISNSVNTLSWSFNTQGINPTPQITFSPNFTNLTPTVNVNQPGLYSFILKETSTICGVVRDTVKILVVQPSLTALSIQPSCAGGGDGEIVLNSPFANEYSFDNGVSWQVSSSLQNLTAGNYFVCAAVPFGCQICDTIQVINPFPLQLSTSNDTTICQNGLATLNANGEGGFTYSYFWNDSLSANNTLLLSPEEDTTVVVYGISNLGCYTDTISIVVSIYPPITATITPNQLICPGSSTTIQVNASGGNGGPYSFEWDNAFSQQGALSNQSVSPTMLSEYSVQVSDGCESTPVFLSSTISIVEITPQITANFTELCEPADFILTNLTSPSQFEQIYWEISGLGYSDEAEINVGPLGAGEYDVVFVITSQEGCIDTTIFENYLTVYPQPIASFTYSPNQLNMFNTSTVLISTSQGASDYLWSIPMGSPISSESANFPISFEDGVSGLYDVYLHVTSEFGCTDSILQQIEVRPDMIIYAPNSFTPDGDEYNNSWFIQTNGIDPYNFQLTVFNRWGEVVWQTSDPYEKWDGTFSGRKVQDGTYNWFLSVKDPQNDSSYTYNGFVNILR